MEKFVLFYTKCEVFAKTFHQNVQILDKNCSFVPENAHLVQKKTKKLYFLHYKCSFCQKISLKCTNFG